MIAAIETPGELHIVLHAGRKNLHVQVTAYCGKQFDASNGTVQVPDRIFADKISWKQVSPGDGQGGVLLHCQKCLIASR